MNNNNTDVKCLLNRKHDHNIICIVSIWYVNIILVNLRLPGENNGDDWDKALKY